MDSASVKSHSASDTPKDTLKMEVIEPKTSVAAGQQARDGSSSSDGDQIDMATAVQNAVNHRNLSSRQIQLTSIAGSIGAALFVAIGGGVLSGPVALLTAFIFWSFVVFCIAQCQIEIVTLFPVDGAFIRLAGRMVDPSLGVLVGWNHFFAQTSFVMFECTIINTLVEYWGYKESPAILISISIVMYMAINVYRADLFGEAEFWLALGKVFLAAGLIVFTIVAMCGGNPLNDRFGFRYWVNPGPWVAPTPSGGLISFVNAVNVAGFCIAGPEYISMIAGEAKDPRRTMPRAFDTIVKRLIIFFIGGALCVGILVPSDDETLTNGGDSYAGGSPYVIAMERLKIPVLPSIVNAALITTIVSAGNAYMFNASRSLHALALDGQAPKIFRRLNKHGVPYVSVLGVALLSCLSYLALGSTTAKVLNWILNFCTAAMMLNWTVISFTWIRFNAAMKAQNIDRKTLLPRASRFQPFAGYFAFIFAFMFLWLQGYAVFLDGRWDVATFIFNYGIIGLALVIGIGWKVIKRTRFRRAKEVDLSSGLEFFDALNEHYRLEREGRPVTRKDKVWAKLF